MGSWLDPRCMTEPRASRTLWRRSPHFDNEQRRENPKKRRRRARRIPHEACDPTGNHAKNREEKQEQPTNLKNAGPGTDHPPGDPLSHTSLTTHTGHTRCGPAAALKPHLLHAAGRRWHRASGAGGHREQAPLPAPRGVAPRRRCCRCSAAKGGGGDLRCRPLPLWGQVRRWKWEGGHSGTRRGGGRRSKSKSARGDAWQGFAEGWGRGGGACASRPHYGSLDCSRSLVGWY